MKLAKLRKLEPGTVVNWFEETGEPTSGVIQEIATETGTIEDMDSLVVVTDSDGHPEEVYASEILEAA